MAISKLKKMPYFSHDCNARSDEKLIGLRIKLGLKGYGAYWFILEMLREKADYKLERNYEAIAFEMRETADFMKSVVEDFGLFAFTKNRKQFYSKSLCARMDKMEEIAEKRSAAGRASAEKRRAAQQKTVSAENKKNSGAKGSKCSTSVAEKGNKEKKSNKLNKRNERNKVKEVDEVEMVETSPSASTEDSFLASI